MQGIAKRRMSKRSTAGASTDLRIAQSADARGSVRMKNARFKASLQREVASKKRGTRVRRQLKSSPNSEGDVARRIRPSTCASAEREAASSPERCARRARGPPARGGVRPRCPERRGTRGVRQEAAEAQPAPGLSRVEMKRRHQIYSAGPRGTDKRRGTRVCSLNESEAWVRVACLLHKMYQRGRPTEFAVTERRVAQRKVGVNE